MSTSENPFLDVAADLRETIGVAVPLLERFTEEESSRPWRAGKWSRKQILGHLIDSATNNHQRFVRATLQGGIAFPEYEQERWVALEQPDGVAWKTLVAFWKLYNRYLAHVIAQLPADAAGYECRVGTASPVTLLFLAQDYVAHMKHHLNQALGQRFESAWGAKA